MFFLIYINDLHNSLESEPRLFADDTCLLVKASNSEQLEINLNTELHHLHLWCSVNKLSVNPAKSNIVIIPPKRIKTPISHLNISSNGTPVNIVSCAKYLGVIIDNELNFHEQIKVMEGKVARAVEMLNKLKQTLPQTVMLQLCYALVHPLLLYGIIIRGATYPTYLQKLKSLQNRAIRAIVGAHFRDSVNPYYTQLKILQIDDLIKFEIAKLVYGSLHNKTPNSFHKYFCKINDRSGRATRQSSDCNNLNIPRYRTNKLQRCIKYQRVRIWNCIPKNIRAFSHKKFKYCYKNFLLFSYKY